MEESMTSDWQKGGVRYAKLKQAVPDFLAPAVVQTFFVGVKSRGGMFRLINPLTPLQREYIIAATTEGLTVLNLRRPGVFRATIAGIAYQAKSEEVDLRWEDGRLIVGGVSYQPIAFHREDAEHLARLFEQ